MDRLLVNLLGGCFVAVMVTRIIGIMWGGEAVFV